MTKSQAFAVYTIAALAIVACGAPSGPPRGAHPAEVMRAAGVVSGAFTQAACTDTGVGGLDITLGDHDRSDRLVVKIVDSQLRTIEVLREDDRIVIPVIDSAGTFTYDDGHIVAENLTVRGSEAGGQIVLHGAAWCG